MFTRPCAVQTRAAVLHDQTIDTFTPPGDTLHARVTGLAPRQESGSDGIHVAPANFKTSGKRWSRDDFNHDTSVNITDFTFLPSNFNQALPAAAPPPQRTAGAAERDQSELRLTRLAQRAGEEI